MKKISIALTLFSFALLFSACTAPNLSGKQTIVTTPAISESPTPTLSKDSSIDSIEADLKATTVLEEDFSDIK